MFSMASAFVTATIKTSHAAMKQLVEHYNTAAQSHPRDIVFHVLSLNGFYHYLFLLIEIRNSKHHNELLKRVKGVIIDSAPARITFDILTRGFVGAVMGVFKHKVSAILIILDRFCRQKSLRSIATNLFFTREEGTLTALILLEIHLLDSRYVFRIRGASVSK